MQGWRRTQEDAHLALPEFGTDRKIALFAVFDGHGGRGVAKFCRKYLPVALKHQQSYKDGNYEDACAAAFQAIDRKLNTREGREEIRKLDRAPPRELMKSAIRVRPQDCLRSAPWTNALARVHAEEKAKDEANLRRKLREFDSPRRRSLESRGSTATASTPEAVAFTPETESMHSQSPDSTKTELNDVDSASKRSSGRKSSDSEKSDKSQGIKKHCGKSLSKSSGLGVSKRDAKKRSSSRDKPRAPPQVRDAILPGKREVSRNRDSGSSVESNFSRARSKSRRPQQRLERHDSGGSATSGGTEIITESSLSMSSSFSSPFASSSDGNVSPCFDSSDDEEQFDANHIPIIGFDGVSTKARANGNTQGCTAVICLVVGVGTEDATLICANSGDSR